MTIKEIINLENRLKGWLIENGYDGFVNDKIGCCGCTFKGNEKSDGELVTFETIDEDCDSSDFEDCKPGYISKCETPKSDCHDLESHNNQKFPCGERIYRKISFFRKKVLMPVKNDDN